MIVLFGFVVLFLLIGMFSRHWAAIALGVVWGTLYLAVIGGLWFMACVILRG